MRSGCCWFMPLLLVLAMGLPAAGADSVELTLPSTRSHFTSAEPIELALLYKNDGGNRKTLPLEVRHADGSTLKMAVPFDVPAGKAQVRLVKLRQWVNHKLKPGSYTAVTSLDGAEKSAAFQVYHAKPVTPYWIAQWVHHGESWGTTQAKGGWMYLTSDLATLHPRKPGPNDLAESYVAARMKPFQRMVFGGGHQLDLDLQNDWGDPWVQRTIAWRMQLAALSNRLYPIAGLHCYDEPGLTWWPTQEIDGHKKDISPFSVPHQHEEFTKRTGRKLPQGPFSYTGPKYAGQMDDWLAFMDLRMNYLEQAWHATVWGTESVEPGFVTLNQVSSSYAPGTTTDGVDSRQNRAYRIVSGHGGYSDMPFGTFQPVRSAEAFRGFTWDRPHYFLPMWYTHTWATIRNAVWMSWTTKLDGMMYTPEQDFGLDNARHGFHGTNTVFEIAEINRRLAMVGDVIRQLPKTPAPVAVIHSHRQFAHDIATLNSPELHKIGSPQYASPHRNAVDACFFRTLEQGFAPNWIDEVEATERGAAFLKQWPVIFCPRLATAAPGFRKALEDYIAQGGKLIQFKGDQLLLKGSIVAEYQFGDPTLYYQEKVGKDGITSPAYRDLAWRKWNNDFAPTFGRDLAGWIGPQEFKCTNKDVLLGRHRFEEATYLLFANNAQSQENPRGVKHELIPAETTVRVPKGVVYDLFNGVEVPVKDGLAKLRLAAGDGACWLHLPRPVKQVGKGLGNLTGGYRLVDLMLRWDGRALLPVRVRLLDPVGRVADERFVAAKPRDNDLVTELHWYELLGNLDAPGAYTMEVTELWSGIKHTLPMPMPASATPQKAAEVGTDPVSIDDRDTTRIVELFAGKLLEPPYDKLNWDARRVFALDARKFAVFGPAEPAEKIAAALKARGRLVEVNPKYEIKPFQREPNRGGAGVTHGVASNLENIYAHTIVLPGHPLATQSFNRGHINRPVTATFPGPDRAYIQWGIGCYQAGWQNIFIFGDTEAGLAWLLAAIAGKPPERKPIELSVAVQAAAPKKPNYLPVFDVAQQIPTDDTPVGVGSSPAGETTYILLYDGSVRACDLKGKTLWTTQALLEGCALAVSPKGNRLAVAGYPGLLVLDAKDGKVLGGHRQPPVEKGHTVHANRMLAVAWNDAGTLAVAGWHNPNPKEPLDPVVVDADGKLVRTLAEKVRGSVMGVAFVPGTEVALFGADQWTAVDAATGTAAWTAPVKGAQTFAFSPDRKQAAAGGWGKTAAVVDLADGRVQQSATFPSVVGGVAWLPSGELVVAVWGGTHPLFVLRRNEKKPEPFFAARFGFQSVTWSPDYRALLAAEQGGRLWLLNADGTVRATLSEDAGTTPYRLRLEGQRILLARMNRVVQRIWVR